MAGDCVAKYVGRLVDVLDARLRRVPLLYKDASIIQNLLGLGEGRGLHSTQPITHVLMGFYEYSAA